MYDCVVFLPFCFRLPLLLFSLVVIIVVADVVFGIVFGIVEVILFCGVDSIVDVSFIANVGKGDIVGSGDEGCNPLV